MSFRTLAVTVETCCFWQVLELLERVEELTPKGEPSHARWKAKDRQRLIQYVLVPEACIAIIGATLAVHRDHAEHLFLTTPKEGPS